MSLFGISEEELSRAIKALKDEFAKNLKALGDNIESRTGKLIGIEERINRKISEFPLGSSQFLQLAGGSNVSLDMIVQQVVCKLDPVITEHISQVVSNLNLEKLSKLVLEKIDMDEFQEKLIESMKGDIKNSLDMDSIGSTLIDNLDMDSVKESLVEAIKEKVVSNLDIKELAASIASDFIENIEDYIDLDDLRGEVAEKISENLEIKLNKSE